MKRMTRMAWWWCFSLVQEGGRVEGEEWWKWL
jgi:hypothetical protein